MKLCVVLSQKRRGIYDCHTNTLPLVPCKRSGRGRGRKKIFFFFCRQQKRMAFCTVATFLKEREKKGAKILMQQCREGKEAFVEKKAPSPPPPPSPKEHKNKKWLGGTMSGYPTTNGGMQNNGSSVGLLQKKSRLRHPGKRGKEKVTHPTNNGGMHNGSSVGICANCMHVFLHVLR